ncbi:MAG TPA: glycoside hydrolase family 16 protein [Sphingomonas sp.]|jgi:hypothetical protein|uniref:glycoside hydrolase family 16 protein n=1 Tax=Sphingomonas sp. TaxID=28214 RepID=UPI002EDB5BDC
MHRLMMGTLAVASATMAVSQTTPVAKIVQTPPSWSDEFTTGLNANDWDRGYSPWPNTIANRFLIGTGERQIYVDGPYLGKDTLATQAQMNTGGTALFLARRMDAATRSRILTKAAEEQVTAATAAAVGKADWASAMIKGSAGRASTFRHGYIEASLQWTPTKESWPAFWLLPKTWGWPPEIDIVEMRIENGIPMAVMTIHSKQPGYGARGCRAPIPRNGRGYHRYGFYWNMTTAVFYLDGKVTCRLPAPSDLNQEFYPILNLAMGGWGAVPTANTADPQKLQVDYVRVWKGY